MSLERCLQEITDESKPLSYSCLVALSHLFKSELERFVRVWHTLGVERRRKVLARLTELAEENLELDFNVVFTACLKDADAEVREKAIAGLWEFEDRSLIATLIQLLTRDTSEKVRAAAAIGLGKFACLAQEGKLLPREGERVKESLLAALKNRGEALEVRRRALEAVAPFNTLTVKEFIRWAYSSQDQELRCSALYAMGKTGEPSWLPLIVKEFNSARPALRYEAANACAELQEEAAVPHLIPLLEDEDLQVQLSTIRALGEIGGPLAVRALKRCIRSEEPSLKEAAREALSNIEGAEDPLAFGFRF